MKNLMAFLCLSLVGCISSPAKVIKEDSQNCFTFFSENTLMRFEFKNNKPLKWKAGAPKVEIEQVAKWADDSLQIFVFKKIRQKGSRGGKIIFYDADNKEMIFYIGLH